MGGGAFVKLCMLTSPAVAAPGFTISGGAKPERRRREDRGAEGVETETPKALTAKGMGSAQWLKAKFLCQGSSEQGASMHSL